METKVNKYEMKQNKKKKYGKRRHKHTHIHKITTENFKHSKSHELNQLTI